MTWQGVHWLTGTCFREADEVVRVVSEHLHGLDLDELPFGRWTYTHQVVERSTDARVLWSPNRDTGEVCVNLPGAACELLGTAGVLALVRELGLKLTRLDVAWDTGIMTPQQVCAAHEAGSAVTHSKTSKWIQEKGGKNSGSTFYVGKRGSDPDVRLVRFYDRRGPTRVELELHGKRAQMLWAVLDGADLADWSAGCLAYLVDFVDFRDRAADPNVGRCPRLEWWEDFTEGAGRLALPLPRQAPTLERQVKFIQHQVAPVLALVADSVPDATVFIRDLLLNGRARRKPYQVAMLHASRLGLS